MKKALFVFLALGFGISGTSQAVVVDTISGFASSDIYEATSSEVLTTAVWTDADGAGTIVVTTDPEKTLSSASGPGDGSTFDHDYIFTAISNNLFGISTTTENTILGSIVGFTVSIFDVLSSNVIPVFTDDLADLGDVAKLTVGIDMLAGRTYRINLAGDVAGSSAPDYRLELAVVPVPAAVWLFGTAMLGLFGMRRKAKMQALAA